MFKDGRTDGYGRIIYNNTNYYIGFHKNGKFDGLGQFVYFNGTILKGIWENGILKNSLLGDKVQDYDPKVV